MTARLVVGLAAICSILFALYLPTLVRWAYAQTPIICEVFVDCTGSGGKVSGTDWNNMRAYTQQHVNTTATHVPQRASADCAAETGGVQDEVCTEAGPPRKIFVCNPGPCEGANWSTYASEAPLVLISGVTSHTAAPSPLDATNCTNTSHINASATAKAFTLCDPAVLTPITSFSAGNTLCFIDNAGGAMTIIPQPTHTISLNDGTSVVDKSAGTSIVSSGTRGDECCLQAISSTAWLTRVCKGFS